MFDSATLFYLPKRFMDVLVRNMYRYTYSRMYLMIHSAVFNQLQEYQLRYFDAGRWCGAECLRPAVDTHRRSVSFAKLITIRTLKVEKFKLKLERPSSWRGNVIYKSFLLNPFQTLCSASLSISFSPPLQLSSSSTVMFSGTYIVQLICCCICKVPFLKGYLLITVTECHPCHSGTTLATGGVT